jgi:hypothetical protein
MIERSIWADVLTSLFLLLPIVAIVYACLGLGEIRKRRIPGELDFTRGRGMATWAILLSTLVLSLVVVGVVDVVLTARHHAHQFHLDT